ncbi:GGDEF domain-containing protein [Neobacillus sp. PS3-34]|uniref:GGDEF domain-containing protein n=1 Tax=Neobacillus sp. PS3-34 TaxID=3070678 RepID=UPI0027E1CECF|nr:GGDEF domain-containing protein [Neobacillus sp. PS3-34]WML49229.1 GGDEF domain-containing protein [Neobacillus sp. PS3-34]
MRFTLYLKDYETEKIFSYIRWIFLLIASMLFYYPPLDNILHFEHRTFNVLLLTGILYMGISQIIFMRMDSNNKSFPTLIKAGIVFDYIALMWLLVLTGGVDSILFPISYLLVMHATIYWRTKGSFLASFFTSLGYTGILFLENNVSEQLVALFLMNIVFIWIIGLFGSLIVLRERKHIKMKEIYHELVVTDYLTGLYNHRHFQEHLSHLTQEAVPFSLIIGDIDNFKPINDRYGHLVGDEVLRCLGKLFGELAEKYNGLAFRYGGEEFAFLIPSSRVSATAEFIEEIYSSMNEMLFTNDQWTATMSFGAASKKEDQKKNELLAIADNLLYKAKKDGKNLACFEDGSSFKNGANTTDHPLYA